MNPQGPPGEQGAQRLLGEALRAQASGAAPRPGRWTGGAAAPRPSRSTGDTGLGLGWMVLIALLTGVLVGIGLALLSVLAPGVLPAIG